MRVGVFGATGQVGGVMRTLLAERDFPVDEIRYFASARSAGTPLPFGDREVLVDETQLAALRTELGAVLDRYRRRGAGTPGARRVTAVVALTPLPRRT